MHSKTTKLGILPYFVAFLLIAMNFSCRSYKTLQYMKDTQDQEKLRGMPKTAPLYHIRAKDNLFVSLVTNDIEVNKLFNPAHAGSAQSINNEYQNAGNAYVYGFEVDTAGFINLPIIGKIKVIGKSLTQTEKIIEDTARHYVKEISAKVKLLNNRVTVLGEVRNPGMYFKYGPDFTIFEAIGMAGSSTNYAELDSVLVVRPTHDGSQTFILNLMTKSAMSSDAYFLQPNDVVILQPGKNKNLELRLPIYTISIAAISAALILVNILVISAH